MSHSSLKKGNKIFTGIVEGRGEIIDVEPSGDGLRMTVQNPHVVDGITNGESISVNGVCLTAVDHTGDSFTADVMAETVAMTTLGRLTPGSEVNLERAAKINDRISGHIIQGHVDGMGKVVAVTPGAKWKVVRISLPLQLAPFVAYKGAITVDGVSLTVSAISPVEENGHLAENQWFEVSLIPETLDITILDSYGVGDLVNIETDILARHVERMLAFAKLQDKKR